MATTEEIAWAAGLFEGEGSVYITRQRLIGAAVASTDRDVLERFAAIVGFGIIHTKSLRRNRPEHWKVNHQWMIQNAPQTRELIALFWPYFGERRRARAQEVLDGGADIGQRREKAAA